MYVVYLGGEAAQINKGGRRTLGPGTRDGCRSLGSGAVPAFLADQGDKGHRIQHLTAKFIPKAQPAL